MSSDVLLTVVTVTFNDLAGLERTAESLMSQTDLVRSEFEWVVVDGASSDGTSDWLDTSALVDRFGSEADDGIYDAMNKGIRMAHGRFVLFLNAGDYLADSAVLGDFLNLVRDVDADLIFGAVQLSAGDRLLRRPARSAAYINHGLPGYHQATFYRVTHLDPPLYEAQYEVSADYYVTASVLVRPEIRTHIWDRDVAVFELGGNSSKRQVRLTVDCAKIQRRVLGLGWPAVVLSAARRQVGNLTNRLFMSRRLAPAVQRVTMLVDPKRRTGNH